MHKKTQTVETNYLFSLQGCNNFNFMQIFCVPWVFGFGGEKPE